MPSHADVSTLVVGPPLGIGLESGEVLGQAGEEPALLEVVEQRVDQLSDRASLLTSEALEPGMDRGRDAGRRRSVHPRIPRVGLTRQASPYNGQRQHAAGNPEARRTSNYASRDKEQRDRGKPRNVGHSL